MAPEVHLDIVGTFDGQLALRGMQKEGGNRQSKLPVKRITPATRQNADARVHVCVSGHADHDSILVDVHTDRPAFVTQVDAADLGPQHRPGGREGQALDDLGLEQAVVGDGVHGVGSALPRLQGRGPGPARAPFHHGARGGETPLVEYLLNL